MLCSKNSKSSTAVFVALYFSSCLRRLTFKGKVFDGTRAAIQNKSFTVETHYLLFQLISCVIDSLERIQKHSSDSPNGTKSSALSCGFICWSNEIKNGLTRMHQPLGKVQRQHRRLYTSIKHDHHKEKE